MALPSTPTHQFCIAIELVVVLVIRELEMEEPSLAANAASRPHYQLEGLFGTAHLTEFETDEMART
jgi:hypothetical protein